jgi:hypothetical protein
LIRKLDRSLDYFILAGLHLRKLPLARLGPPLAAIPFLNGV